MTTTFILGSGPNVVNAREWAPLQWDTLIAINNAWSVRADWDYMIHPDDFADDRKPAIIKSTQSIVTAHDYVPIQNTYGGFVYAGGTMAFTAAYWTLGALRPSVIAMMGCDMIYDAPKTHFYGTGTPDPLRDDISLRSLTAKSERLRIIAAKQGCAIVNLSVDPSRLTFPRATPSAAAASLPAPYNATVAAAALAEEDRLGYYVLSGKYWRETERFDQTAIDQLDAMWIKAGQPDGTAP